MDDAWLDRRARHGLDRLLPGAWLVYFGAGAIAAVQAGPNYLDLGLLAVVLLAAIAIWRMLNAGRPKALEPAAGGAVHAAGAAPGATAASPPHKAA